MGLERVDHSADGATILGRLDDTTEQTALTDSVAATVADELVDSFGTVVWHLALTNSNGTRERWTVMAHHDGTSSADATTATYTRSGAGPDNGHTVAVDLNGTGSSQTMRLRVTANGSGWTADVTRIYHEAA